MPSVYGGIAEGINDGFRLADSVAQRDRQAKLDQERQEDRQTARGLQARQLGDNEQARMDAQAERQRANRIGDAKNEIADLDNQIGSVQSSLLDLTRRGVGNDDPVATKLRQQGAQLTARKQAAYARTYGPQLQQDWNQAKSDIQTLSDPKADPRQLPDDRVYSAYSLAYGDNIDKLYAPEFGKNLQQLNDGLDQFNELQAKGDHAGAQKIMHDTILPAYNVVAAPEVQHGVGQPSPDGTGTIVDQKITRVMPSPRDPNKLVVGLRNQVQHPDGSTSDYEAPLTNNRSSSPDDHVKELDPKELLDHVGRINLLYEHLQDPAIKQKIENAKANGADARFADNRSAYFALGGDPAKIEDEATWEDAGDRKVAVSKRTGRRLADVPDIVKGAAPREYDPAGEDLKRATADYYRNNRGQVTVLVDKNGNQTPYNQGDQIPPGSSVQRIGGPGAAASAGGGGGGGKRGEYIDMVARALQASDPKLAGEKDINKLRFAALEYTKRDPVKLAATVAAQMRKDQNNPLFTGPKLTEPQIAQNARAIVDSLAAQPAEAPAAAPGAPPLSDAGALPATPAAGGRDYSGLWKGGGK